VTFWVKQADIIAKEQDFFENSKQKQDHPEFREDNALQS